MPQRKHRFGSVLRLVFLAAALSLLGAAVRRGRAEANQSVPLARARRRKVRIAPRRLAASLAFAALFFAGASFSAGAGNTVARLLEKSETALSADTTTTTTTTEDPAAAPGGVEDSSDDEGDDLEEESPTAPLEEAPAEPEAPPTEQPAAAPEESPEQDDSPAPHRPNPAAAPSGHSSTAPGASPHQKPRGGGHDDFDRAPPVIAPQPKTLRVAEEEPEASAPGTAATVWLHRVLPDPTPASRRLTPAFARRLARASARNHVDWALVLGVLRAAGERGSVPATQSRLKGLAKRLHSLRAGRNPWSAALALEGRTSFADRAIALQRYHRAVGLKALVRGLEWAKPSLSKRVLSDSRISMYSGGRADIQASRIDIRVLVLIAYLAEAHGQVTVSCLISGHRLYSRPGVVSAHIYGHAVDVAALGGASIVGNQQPGGVTEQAVRNILLLPAELRPRQVISLLGLGGPSFPLANHDDHIHVGY